MIKIGTIKFKKIKVFLIFLSGFLLASCLKDNFDFDRFSDRVSYRPSFAIPLAHGSLTLGNLLEADDSLVFFDPDNSIRIVIREDSLFSVSATEILDMSLPGPVSRQFRTDPLLLADFTSTASISLRDLTDPARTSDPAASVIRDADGGTILFPPVYPQYLGNFPASPLPDIDHAYFTAGVLELQVRNNLPVEVSLLVSLINDADGGEIGLFMVNNLGPLQQASMYSGLEGRLIRSSFSLQLLSFSTPGSDETPVTIDLDKGLEMGIFSENLRSAKGKARLPVTGLDQASDIMEISFGLDQVVEAMSLDNGRINHSISNNATGLTLKIDFPNLSRSGDTYGFEIIPNGSGGTLSGVKDLTGTGFDFSGHGTNMLIDYTLVIGSDQEMTDYDLEGGTLDLNMDFSEFIIGSAFGDFGNEELIMDDEDIDLDFELFDKINGEFLFSNPSIRLFYINSTGVPASVSFNLTGESPDGKNLALFSKDLEEFPVDYARSPGDIVSGDILVNRDNSEIVNFIALPPSRINLKARTQVNPAGKPSVPNFLTPGSKLQVGMEIELPLEMQLTSLQLSDTLEMNLDDDDIDIIESLAITIEVRNGFPMSVALDLGLYDSARDLILHNFENIVLMEAAAVDAGGISIHGNETTSVAGIEIAGNIIDYLKQADHFILSARLNTGKHNEQQVPVKLLTTNRLDFNIRLKASLDINN